MRPPSTRTQVLIVWTIMCGAPGIGLALVASQPPQCFECGMGSAVALMVLQFLFVLWVVGVAVAFWAFRPPSE